MTLYFATKNPNKKKEVLNLLQFYISPKEIKLFAIDDIIAQNPDLGSFKFDVDETGSSFMENAALKAQALSKIIPREKIIAEDSGLLIDRLGNRPGILSSRYASSSAEGIKKVLDEMKDFSDMSDRKAFFFTSLCYIDENGNKIFFHGRAEGFIAHEPKGEHGFGYDPIFYLPKVQKTFSELTLKEKQSYSHRSYAFVKFLKFINKKSD